MACVSGVGPPQTNKVLVRAAKRALGPRSVMCLLVACGGLGFAGGSGASPRRVGVLTGGIYKMGGPASPYGCYDNRCPTVGRVIVRDSHEVIVARARLTKRGQRFRFLLAPGRYHVKARCSGHPFRQEVRVVAGHTTHTNVYCSIR